MFNIKDYILDNSLRINIIDNKLNIVNYSKIILIKDDNIVVSSINKKINIIGSELKFKKILDNEILITGNINELIMENIDV